MPSTNTTRFDFPKTCCGVGTNVCSITSIGLRCVKIAKPASADPGPSNTKPSTSATRRSQRGTPASSTCSFGYGDDSKRFPNLDALPHGRMSVEIERSVTVHCYFQKISDLRISAEVDSAVHPRRFALRAAKPHIVSPERRAQWIALAQTPALFDEHAHALTDTLRSSSFRRKALRFAQAHEPRAALACRHLTREVRARRSLLRA